MAFGYAKSPAAINGLSESMTNTASKLPFIAASPTRTEPS